MLRSVEGEGLAEYTKRAYNVYRVHGIIQGGMLADERTLKPRDVSLPPDLHDVRPSTSSTSARVVVGSPAVCMDAQALTADRSDGRQVTPDTCTSAKVGVREPVRPFSPPGFPHDFLPSDEHVVRNGSDHPTEHNFATPCSTHKDDLRLVDVSEAEEVATSDATEAKPGPKRRGSRLRAPRAGLALKLASANARGITTSRTERSPDFRRDSSGNPLPPPPPVVTVLAHRRQAWKEGIPADHSADQPGRRSSGLKLEGSKGDVGISGEKGAVRRGLAAPTPAGDLTDHSTSQTKEVGDVEIYKNGENENYATVAMSCGERGFPTAECPAKLDASERSTLVGSSARVDADTNCHPQQTLDGGRAHDLGYPGTGAGHPTCRSNVNDARVATAPAPLHSPEEVYRSPVAHAKEVVHENDDVEALPVQASPRETLVRMQFGIDGDPANSARLSETGLGVVSKQGLAGSAEPRGAESFVWFGQPDTPSSPKPDGSIDKGRANGAVTPKQNDEIPIDPKRKSQAEILLQMEVRHQREIIARSAQAREEEERFRRVQLGAEVLKRYQLLRCNAPPTLYAADTDSSQGRGEHTAEDATVRYPSDNADKTTGASSTGAPVALSGPEVRSMAAPDAYKTRETSGDVGPVPKTPNESKAGVQAGNPWLRVGGQEGADTVPAKRAPTPPPISFDVTADGFGGGEGRMGGRGDQEQIRRQQRFEALRARKVAEAEVCSRQSVCLAGIGK